MSTKELVAKFAGTAVVVLIPIATLSPGASAAQKPQPTPKPGPAPVSTEPLTHGRPV